MCVDLLATYRASTTRLRATSRWTPKVQFCTYGVCSSGFTDENVVLMNVKLDWAIGNVKLAGFTTYGGSVDCNVSWPGTNPGLPGSRVIDCVPPGLLPMPNCRLFNPSS